MTTNLVGSVKEFQAGFQSRLRSMVSLPHHSDLVVLAGQTASDPTLHSALGMDLDAALGRLKADEEGLMIRRGAAAPGDAKTVDYLLEVGASGLTTVQYDDRGDWVVQYNPLREFRPPGVARKVEPVIRLNVQHGARTFADSDLRRECFWCGDLAGRDTGLFYNKYPLSKYHTLVVPQNEPPKPQYLEAEDFGWLWKCASTLLPNLPGAAIGFNSYGAGASINHLHAQLILAPARLPILATDWSHNGGDRPYPLPVSVHDSEASAWQWIDCRQQKELGAYNLLFSARRVFCFARRHAYEYKPADWTSGFAFFELCGIFPVSTQNIFATLSPGAIEAEFERLRPDEQS